MTIGYSSDYYDVLIKRNLLFVRLQVHEATGFLKN